MSGSAAIRIVLATPADAGLLVRRFEAWADPVERSRRACLAREADRVEYAAAHALLRGELAREMQVPPERLRFARGANGKPFLIGDATGPGFSLSHSRAHAMVAISRLGQVGADLELTSLGPVSPALVARIAAPAEAMALPADAAGLERALIRLWVVKEATAKMTGEGLSCEPRLLHVAPRADGRVHVLDLRRPGTPPIAYARLIATARGGAAAVAVPVAHAAALTTLALQSGSTH